MDSLTPSAVQRLNYDVLTLLALYLPWRVLMTWRWWSRPFDEIAAKETIRRIRAVFDSHIPKEHLPAFFDLLDTTFGVVAGTAPFRLLSSREQTVALSNIGNVLDIIVHAEMENYFRSFFFDLGYKFKEELPTKRLGPKVKHVEVYEKVENEIVSTAKRPSRFALT